MTLIGLLNFDITILMKIIKSTSMSNALILSLNSDLNILETQAGTILKQTGNHPFD